MGVAHARGIPFRHVYRLVFGSQADHALGTQEVIIVDAKLGFMLTIVGASHHYQNAIWKQQMEKLLAQLSMLLSKKSISAMLRTLIPKWNTFNFTCYIIKN